jgi:hypothetical protein
MSYLHSVINAAMLFIFVKNVNSNKRNNERFCVKAETFEKKIFNNKRFTMKVQLSKEKKTAKLKRWERLKQLLGELKSGFACHCGRLFSDTGSSRQYPVPLDRKHEVQIIQAV